MVESLADEAGELMVDYVGKLETALRDFSTVCEKMGVSGVDLGWANRSESIDVDEVSALSPEDRGLLYEYYEKDFRVFGYEP